MKPGRRQVYEEEFVERARLSEVEEEMTLRRAVLLELEEEQKRLRSGSTEKELEVARNFEKGRAREARSSRAIATGSLEVLIKEEELEKKAELVRGQLTKELGVQTALRRTPVFLLTAVRRSQTERMFKERAFNALVKGKLNEEKIKRAIRNVDFANGELAVDKERAIAVIHGSKGRSLLNALKTA